MIAVTLHDAGTQGLCRTPGLSQPSVGFHHRGMSLILLPTSAPSVNQTSFNTNWSGEETEGSLWKWLRFKFYNQDTLCYIVSRPMFFDFQSGCQPAQASMPLTWCFLGAKETRSDMSVVHQDMGLGDQRNEVVHCGPLNHTPHPSSLLNPSRGSH